MERPRQPTDQPEAAAAASGGFEEGQRRILERVAEGAPLPEVLRELTLLIERQRPGKLMCSVLLLDRDHGCVRHGAAPSLPAEFVRGIDGLPIGPQAGSCGTAAYLGERVIVEDISSHPAWEHYRAIALPHGLRACWSTPIFSSTREVLGTFAMYYRETHGPDEGEIELVARATHLAAVAIQHERAKVALRKNMRMRQLVFDNVVDVLFSIDVGPDESFRFQCINRAFTRITGLSEEQVVGRLVSDIVPEPARSRVLANYRACVRERRTVYWDEVSEYPTGTRHGSATISPVFDEEDGVCRTLVGTVHDVTERMTAEARIRDQAALIDRASDAIMVRDLDGTIRFWSEGATRLYGWTAAEAVGRSVTELLYRDTRAYARAERKVRDGGSWEGELEQIDKARRAVTIEGRWTLLHDDAGQPRSVLAINTDVTERRQVERRLLRTQRMESLGQLAGAIAHDFNNILVAILANARMGQEDAADVTSGSHFADIESAGARAASLVRQILTFSREEAPKRELVRLPAIVEEALKLLRISVPPTIAIATTIAPDVPEILADSTQLHQVVMNLCANATHAVGDGVGRVDVRVERVVLDRRLVDSTVDLLPGTYARVTVEDSGAGMDEAVLDHIFDPFFTTKAAGKGTGLGLSVVHGIVKSHQGGIVVRSAPGAGSTFAVYFPAAG